jgi:hypothetical protein
MTDCPRCLVLTNDEFAYCTVCGRPRIVESLRTPKAPPDWLRPLQLIVLGVLSLWLVITLGVAFLREFKAVRDARVMLVAGHYQEAWALLGPFLQEHPRHEQGLLLGGQATIRLGQFAEAKQSLGTLTEESPELSQQLGDDYRQFLTQKAREVGCNAEAFYQTLTSAQSLGNPFPASVTDGLDGFVEACRKNGDTLGQGPSQLAQRGLGSDLIRKGYVPVISRDLQEAQYSDAKALAQQAVRLVPAAGDEVRKVLNTERAKVMATIRTLGELCKNLKNDPRNHPGDAWCLPPTTPATSQTAKDGWGNTFTYTVFAANIGQTCHPGSSFTSYGAAGHVAEEGGQSPAAGITCRLVFGAESWKLPERFWLESSQTDG